jgi:hypothetical protein
MTGTRIEGTSTASDFRRLAETAAWGSEEQVTLPESGLAVIVRRPTKFYWALRRSSWPRPLREKIDAAGVGVKPQFSVEELLLLAAEDEQMLQEAFVEPKAQPEPGPAQFDPNWLPREDAEFILGYLRGQVLASGQDLEAFRRGQSAAVEGGRADGTALRKDSGRNAPATGCSVED